MQETNRVYLVKEHLLPLIYAPGMGAWTYHLEIPQSQELKGAWGKLKVSGSLDELPIHSRNLFSRTGKNKILSINQEIRQAIQKKPGDLIRVTLYLEQGPLSWDEQKVKELAFTLGFISDPIGRNVRISPVLIQTLNGQETEDKQIQLLLDWLKDLENGG
jgi:hypothetical protein